MSFAADVAYLVAVAVGDMLPSVLALLVLFVVVLAARDGLARSS